MFLEWTLYHFAWQFAIKPPVFLLVIWALGLSMVILSALVYLPKKVIAGIAIVVIAAHNLLDGINAQNLGAFGPLWHVLHQPGPLMLKPFMVFIGYPIVPWFAVMALGFVLGDVFKWEPERRRKFLIRAGLAMIAAFFVLRLPNLYGDTFSPWSVQKTWGLTLSSIGNATKYPPSLIYLLMTLGPTFIALALFENARGKVSEVISVYGRVPMFYYTLHLLLIHTLAVGFALYQGGDASFLNLDTEAFPKWYGTNLAGVYLAWAMVVSVLYVPCRWFAGVKARRRDWWLSYM
jgi:uncharacterized membrane protein